MDIRVISRGVKGEIGLHLLKLCVDGKCHVEIGVLHSGRTCSSWEVGPCDGGCCLPKLPKYIQGDILAFIRDGKPRKGEADGDILDGLE